MWAEDLGRCLEPMYKKHPAEYSHHKASAAMFLKNTTNSLDLYSNITEIFFKSKNSSTFAAAKMATSLSLLEEWQSG